MTTSPEADYLATLSNRELFEELTLTDADLSDSLWVEVGLRLGVPGVNGIRPTAVPEAATGAPAARLRRFMAPVGRAARSPAMTSRRDHVGPLGAGAGAHQGIADGQVRV